MKIKPKLGEMRGGWRVYLFSRGWFFNTREFPGTEYLDLDQDEYLGVQLGDIDSFPAYLLIDPYLVASSNDFFLLDSSYFII